MNARSCCFKDAALGVLELGDLFVLRVCVCGSVDHVLGVRDVLPGPLLLPLAA